MPKLKETNSDRLKKDLKVAMIQRGYDYKKLAAVIGTEAVTVGHYMCNPFKTPVYKMRMIAKALKLSPETLALYAGTNGNSPYEGEK